MSFGSFTRKQLMLILHRSGIVAMKQGHNPRMEIQPVLKLLKKRVPPSVVSVPPLRFGLPLWKIQRPPIQCK